MTCNLHHHHITHCFIYLLYIMSVTKMIALKLLRWQIRAREWWFGIGRITRRRLNFSSLTQRCTKNLKVTLRTPSLKLYFTNVSAQSDISSETLIYFMVNNPRLGRFYSLPKIRKRLFDVLGRPVI